MLMELPWGMIMTMSCLVAWQWGLQPGMGLVVAVADAPPMPHDVWRAMIMARVGQCMIRGTSDTSLHVMQAAPAARPRSPPASQARAAGSAGRALGAAAAVARRLASPVT